MDADEPRIRWVEVDCPMCGNVNRWERRRCKNCKRTGKVMKSVPVKRVQDDG